MPNKTVTIENLTIGMGNRLTLIAGPCVLETYDLAARIAESLVANCQRLGLGLIFKASFDKANRTSFSSYRGVGMEQGLAMLAKIRQEFAIPVTTDIHLPHQAAAVGEVCQLLQIPAFLARQTDLLVAAGQTGRAVNVKKGQFMAPQDMKFVIGKLAESGCHDIMLTERGTFFGYGRLVNDMKGLAEMCAFEVPVVFDATHSVQEPSAADGRTGGNRGMVPILAKSAVAAGCHAVFLETHPDPDQSPSDGANMIRLNEVEKLLIQLDQIHQIVAGD